MPSLVPRLTAALLSLGLIVLGSGPAAAHASLVGSDPEDGSRLSSAPSAVTLTFNENIGNPAYVAVTAPDGSTVAVSDVEAVDREVTATLSDPGQRGRHTVSYRVVSADGHPVEGSLDFTTTTGRTVTQVDPPEQESFVHRHSSHLVWAGLAAVLAIALILAPLRGRHDKSGT